MFLITHVLIAISSLLYTSYIFFSPSKTKLRISYGFVGATLLSGTYLVISTHAPMLQSCQTGFTYLLIVSFGIALAHRQLAQKQKI